MEIREISSVIFDGFASKSSKSHFMQSSSWGEVSKTRGYTPRFLGVYDNDELRACALLLEKKVLIYKTFFCPRGPLLDYQDKVLLKEVINLLKDYSKKHNGLYVKMDPDLPIHLLDANIKPTYTYDNNLKTLDYLKELGLKHRGFTLKFKESSNPRFTFRVDVKKNEEELLNSFHSTTRNLLKRNNPYNIEVYKGDSNDVKRFYQTMRETAKRKKMYLEPLSFFENFYNILNKQNHSDIYIAKINITKLKETYNEKLNSLEEEFKLLDKYSPKKQESLKLDLNDRKAKLIKEMSMVNEINDEEVILSGVITAKYDDKVWIIHGGNSDKLFFLNGNYELYYYILKDAKAQGYSLVDFYGSEGLIDKSSNEYGIYLFKLRFGGAFLEFMGEFDLITKPIMNAIISKALHIRRRLLIKKSTKEK